MKYKKKKIKDINVGDGFIHEDTLHIVIVAGREHESNKPCLNTDTWDTVYFNPENEVEIAYFGVSWIYEYED